MKIIKPIIKFIVKIYVKVIYRVNIIGKENIPITDGAIICANHRSALDPVLMVATTKRQLNNLAKVELFKTTIARWLAKMFGIYPVKRNGSDIETVKISLKLLKNKELLAIFPEGTRNGIEKGIKPKSGAVILAIKSGVKIVPLGIKGTLKPFKKAILNYGEPIDYSKYKEETKNKELMDELTKELMDKIIKLSK